MLLAYVVYIAGGVLVGSDSGAVEVLSDAAQHPSQVAAGALLMLANSAFVIAIGALALPILRPGHEVSAYGYLIARAVEGVMLAVGVVFFLLLVPLAQEYTSTDNAPALAKIAIEANKYFYQVGMISLGIGGLVFCRVLFRARFVPRPLAVWGLVGYGVFLVGMVLETLGYRVGVALSVPGGLFEVALGVLLLAKGFPAPTTQGPDRPDAARPASDGAAARS